MMCVSVCACLCTRMYMCVFVCMLVCVGLCPATRVSSAGRGASAEDRHEHRQTDTGRGEGADSRVTLRAEQRPHTKV